MILTFFLNQILIIENIYQN